MKKTLIALVAVFSLWTAGAEQAGDPAAEILALERKAMDAWMKGDPDPQLNMMDPQITYFHVMVENRLDGQQAVKELYERYRGRPLFESYEILTPKVQLSGEVAVLTYRLAQRTAAGTAYWDGTQVYQKKKEGWRVIHTHWSAAKGQQP